MAALEAHLVELGLSEKEVAVYLALVRHGTHPTSFVAKKSGLNRGTTYLALHSLLDKGLVSKNVKRSVQYFTAQNPENIRYYLERRRDEVSAQLEQSEDIISQIFALSKQLSNKPRIQFFEGAEGARNAMLDTLKAADKNLLSFLSIHDVADFLGAEFFEDYTNKRITEGPALRAIRNRSKDEIAFFSNPYAKKYLTNRADRREVRYLEQPIEFPMSLYLYDNKVTALSSRDEGYALIVQSQDLASMLKMLFETLWRISVPSIKPRSSKK